MTKNHEVVLHVLELPEDVNTLISTVEDANGFLLFAVISFSFHSYMFIVFCTDGSQG